MEGNETKQKAPQTPTYLLAGSVLGFIAGMLLVMSYASPYWLASWDSTFSPFKNMGLWEFCFHRFRYPAYQFDHLFDGCHYVFSEEYRVIWEWLLPGWLMTVQAFMTLALIFSLLSQIIITFVLVRWPLHFVFQYEWQITGLTVVCHGITVIFLFLGVVVFGGECWRRDWLLYPLFNYLSWSYAFAVLATFLHLIAAALLLKEARKARERKRESNALVVQMQQPGHSLQGSGYI